MIGDLWSMGMRLVSINIYSDELLNTQEVLLRDIEENVSIFDIAIILLVILEDTRRYLQILCGWIHKMKYGTLWEMVISTISIDI